MQSLAIAFTTGIIESMEVLEGSDQISALMQENPSSQFVRVLS